MKFITDLLPVILFVVAYQMYDIYIATLVLMGAVIAQLGLLKLTGHPIEKMHWVTLALVLAFGGLTISFRDPLFIMWKPTVVNWLLAAVLLISGWLMRRSLMQRMLDQIAIFPDQVVKRLNYAWAVFFVFLGIINLWVAYNFSEETWVNFKLFGLMGLSLIFVIGQGFYLARYMPKNATED
jgi:intracellular septation protein